MFENVDGRTTDGRTDGRTDEIQKSRAITKKVKMQDLWFLFSARRLI